MTGQTEGWGNVYGGHPAQPAVVPQPPYAAAGAPQGWGPPYPYFVPVARTTTNGLAIASMVLGIVWFYWLTSIAAVVFGHVALHQIKKDPCSTGRGMAIAGLVLGYLWLVLGVVLAIVIWAAVSSAPDTATDGTDATYALSVAVSGH